MLKGTDVSWQPDRGETIGLTQLLFIQKSAKMHMHYVTILTKGEEDKGRVPSVPMGVKAASHGAKGKYRTVTRQ